MNSKPLSLAVRVFYTQEQGATAIEYALLGALIAAVIVVVVSGLGTVVRGSFCGFLTAMGIAC
jgi:pilus assembly protein Flp/PilA